MSKIQCFGALQKCIDKKSVFAALKGVVCLQVFGFPKTNINLYKPVKQKINMGFVAVQMKLMPDSPSADLKAIEKTAEEKINFVHKTIVKVEEQPIAFGLKAIILSFAWNDEIEIEKLEAELSKIEHISSVELLDVRKAFG